MAVLAKILVEEAPRVRELREDVPQELDRLVQRMVAKEPRAAPARRRAARAVAREACLHIACDPIRPKRITARERRVVSVLVVVLPPDDDGQASTTDVTASGTHPLMPPPGA